MMLTEKGSRLAGLEGLRDTVFLLAESKVVVSEQLDFTDSTKSGGQRYEIVVGYKKHTGWFHRDRELGRFYRAKSE